MAMPIGYQLKHKATIADTLLLNPTALYAKPLLPVLQRGLVKGWRRGISGLLCRTIPGERFDV
jgi:phosphoribosylaminoimidazole (AIR) synthetase